MNASCEVGAVSKIVAELEFNSLVDVVVLTLLPQCREVEMREVSVSIELTSTVMVRCQVFCGVR